MLVAIQIEVLYYAIEKTDKNFKFIATLADLLSNNEAGKKLQELLKAAYPEEGFFMNRLRLK